jgi:hypothetical protein
VYVINNKARISQISHEKFSVYSYNSQNIHGGAKGAGRSMFLAGSVCCIGQE